MSGITLTLDTAHQLVVAALTACNTSNGNAEAVARALVSAEADGQSGHGLSRVPSYAAQARAGKVDGHATPTSDWVAPGALTVDAAFGFAYPAINLAISELVPRVKSNGIAVAAIRRSHHFGQAGAHCERLAAEGLVAFVFGNSPKAMAAWGGKRSLLGTNPIAFAAPMVDGPPLVIDLALSRVARGKVMAARQAGKSIPEGWALDADGEPTTDPEAALAGGTMVPIGEAKGAALAMMVEIMSACLCGAHLAYEASSMFDTEGGPPNLGHSVIAIDPGPLSGGAFGARLADFASACVEEDGVRLPGVRRLANRQRAADQGLIVDAGLHARIKGLSRG